MNERQSVLGRVAGWLGIKQPAKEIIGKVNRQMRRFFDRYSWNATQDNTMPNYAWYDQARRGLASGLELAGVLLKPINSKVASWGLGSKPPSFMVANPQAQEGLGQWMREHWATILQTYEDAVGLGDAYLVVNPDLSLSAVQPDAIEPIVDDNDYSRIIGWRVRQTFPHPSEMASLMYVSDEFYPDRRVRTTKIKNVERVEIYKNLIGRLPIIHIPNNQGPNETFGRPECEALVRSKYSVLQRYNEVMEAGINGNIRQGRPIRSYEFDDPAGVQLFQDLYGAEDDDGNVTITVDSDQGVLMSGGKINMVSPGSFAGDSEKFLAILFYLVVQHSEIPEFALGVSIASSQASAETQMPPFIKWIEKKRGECEKWLLELAMVVMALQNLRGRVGLEMPKIEWSTLEKEDKALQWQVAQGLYRDGAIDGPTYLRLAPVDIDDIEGVYNAAQTARNQDAQLEAQYQAALNQPAADDQAA